MGFCAKFDDFCEVFCELLCGLLLRLTTVRIITIAKIITAEIIAIIKYIKLFLGELIGSKFCEISLE